MKIVKTTVKKILSKSKIIITGIVILAILYFIYCALWRLDLLDNIQTKYLNKYQDYYFTTKVVWRTSLISGESVGRQIVYIRPGKKGKMLEKIKEDVNYYLEKTIEKYSDIYYKYEISNDFKEIYIYKISNNSQLLNIAEIIRIESLIALYHNIKKGGNASMPSDYIFEIIKPGD